MRICVTDYDGASRIRMAIDGHVKEPMFPYQIPLLSLLIVIAWLSIIDLCCGNAWLIKWLNEWLSLSQLWFENWIGTASIVCTGLALFEVKVFALLSIKNSKTWSHSHPKSWTHCWCSNVLHCGHCSIDPLSLSLTNATIIKL